MRKIVLAVVITALAGAPALACGPSDGRGIPAIGKSIDAHLTDANLNTADKDKVASLRGRMQKFMTDGKMEEARKTEEEAIRIARNARCDLGATSKRRHVALESNVIPLFAGAS